MWKEPFVVKGIMHPDDADMAFHWARTQLWFPITVRARLTETPASIDVLPEIAERVNGRATRQCCLTAGCVPKRYHAGTGTGR
ncbi:MAG: alpha-hydroxy-acid oxidizing protein [Nitratireductor sp.]